MKHILPKHFKQIINSGVQGLHFRRLFAPRGFNFVVFLGLGAPFVVYGSHAGTIARFYVAFLTNCTALCLPMGAQGVPGMSQRRPKEAWRGRKMTLQWFDHIFPCGGPGARPKCAKV